MTRQDKIRAVVDRRMNSPVGAVVIYQMYNPEWILGGIEWLTGPDKVQQISQIKPVEAEQRF